MSTSLDSTYELVIERHLALTPEECFAFWTDPTTMTEWWGPKDNAGEPFHSEVESWTAVQGQNWSIRMTAPDGTVHVQGGEMLEVDPPNGLRFSFHWSENGERGPTTEVSVRFDARGGGTMLTFTQRGFSEAEVRDSHEQGWKECLDRLEDAVSRGLDPTA